MAAMSLHYIKWSRGAALLGAAVLLTACPKINPGPEYNPTPYVMDYADHFPYMELNDANPMTEEGVALGKALYYDPLLHPQEAMACASCHFQESAFSSFTMSGASVLPHMNMGWSEAYLWNGKLEGTLEEAMIFEVDEFFATDLSKLQSDPHYPTMYYEAFGDSIITTDMTAKALAQFLRTVISDQSRFDDHVYKQIPSLTSQEQVGFAIFMSEQGDCFHCHPPPLFTDNEYHNNGLDSAFAGNEGRYDVTGDPMDMGRFKTPSLRNVELTGPYMHDGRYFTLEEVIEHYHHGVKASTTLDPLMTKENGLITLSLTANEKAALVAFLKSLTDTVFISNPDFGN